MATKLRDAKIRVVVESTQPKGGKKKGDEQDRQDRRRGRKERGEGRGGSAAASFAGGAVGSARAGRAFVRALVTVGALRGFEELLFGFGGFVRDQAKEKDPVTGKIIDTIGRGAEAAGRVSAEFRIDVASTLALIAEAKTFAVAMKQLTGTTDAGEVLKFLKERREIIGALSKLDRSKSAAGTAAAGAVLSDLSSELRDKIKVTMQKTLSPGAH